ncbi:MAG: hypothetical protein ACK5KU_08475 [Beutenbergiaceae bacterium]
MRATSCCAASGSAQALTLGIPVGAIGTYLWLVEQRIGVEANVVVVLTAGPVSVAMLVWAALVLWRRGSRTPRNVSATS